MATAKINVLNRSGRVAPGEEFKAELVITAPPNKAIQLGKAGVSLNVHSTLTTKWRTGSCCRRVLSPVILPLQMVEGSLRLLVDAFFTCLNACSACVHCCLCETGRVHKYETRCDTRGDKTCSEWWVHDSCLSHEWGGPSSNKDGEWCCCNIVEVACCCCCMAPKGRHSTLLGWQHLPPLLPAADNGAADTSAARQVAAGASVRLPFSVLIPNGMLPSSKHLWSFPAVMAPKQLLLQDQPWPRVCGISWPEHSCLVGGPWPCGYCRAAWSMHGAHVTVQHHISGTVPLRGAFTSDLSVNSDISVEPPAPPVVHPQQARSHPTTLTGRHSDGLQVTATLAAAEVAADERLQLHFAVRNDSARAVERVVIVLRRKLQLQVKVGACCNTRRAAAWQKLSTRHAETLEIPAHTAQEFDRSVGPVQLDDITPELYWSKDTLRQSTEMAVRFFLQGHQRPLEVVFPVTLVRRPRLGEKEFDGNYIAEPSAVHAAAGPAAAAAGRTQLPAAPARQLMGGEEQQPPPAHNPYAHTAHSSQHQQQVYAPQQPSPQPMYAQPPAFYQPHPQQPQQWQQPQQQQQSPSYAPFHPPAQAFNQIVYAGGTAAPSPYGYAHAAPTPQWNPPMLQAPVGPLPIGPVNNAAGQPPYTH